MLKPFTPADWYWIANDGRLFATARGAFVAQDDAAYAAWCADRDHKATAWPTDAAGAQTNASLQEVLAPFGLFVDLSAYAAAKRYAVETGGIVVNGAGIATDRDSQAMIGNAYSYVQASGAASVSYKTKAGFVTLTAEQIKAVALAVGAHVQACFAAEDRVDAALSDGTMKTLGEIDAAFAGLSLAA